MRIGIARTSECTFTLSQIRGAEVRRRNASHWRPVSCCTEDPGLNGKKASSSFFFFFFYTREMRPEAVRRPGIFSTLRLTFCVLGCTKSFPAIPNNMVVCRHGSRRLLVFSRALFAEIAQYQCKGHPSRRHLLVFFIVSVVMGYKQWNKMAITIVYWLVRGAPSSSWPPM